METQRRGSCSHTVALLGLAMAVCGAASSPALASGVIGEIHRYCGDTIAIVIGSTTSDSDMSTSIELKVDLKVERWIKSPEVATLPTTLRLKGYMFIGSGFPKLAKKGRFVVFVFAGNRTGDGRLGSIIKIGEGGKLPKSLYLRCLDPRPKTVDDLVGQIRRVLSKEYQTELVKRLADASVPDPKRAEAATWLGGLRARHAWAALKAQATKPGRAENDATIRQSLLALFRIDEAKTTPLALRLVETSRYNQQVGTAAWLLARRPSRDPKALKILLQAARRWEDDRTDATEGHHALAYIIQAITGIGKKTPEVEALVMRKIEKGSGNVRHVSIAAAGILKIHKAVPLICRQLKSLDKNLRHSASMGIAYLVGAKAHPYIGHRQPSEDEARRTAADAFPAWRKAISKAQTIKCSRKARIVIASEGRMQAYILVTWPKQSGQTQPPRKAILLYQTDGAKK